MPTPARSSSSLLTWLLALALLFSVGLNLYCLTPSYRSARATPSASLNNMTEAEEDDDDDDDDASWAALAEELRQTRQQLAACQGQSAQLGTAATSH
ncbi:hypothetical protein SAMN06265337_3411 [Hymenobacter gelipurpurascens]|uniref:Uncharacterized protein n=2 Tax=Hymenobacter gelipurpurascens TaxID=89968 RepID=A0A212UE16_9BACT|nr:hypothetical protein SAMN06265337_3411 [Hymenobacter gelipurpurascens]